MVSDNFRMSKGRLFGFFLFRYGKWWMILLSTLVIGLIIVSILSEDLRFSILALMVGLIMTPMILAFVIINHSLHPDITFNVMLHSLELDTSSIRIRILYTSDVSERNVSDNTSVVQGDNIVTESDLAQYEEIVRNIPYNLLETYIVGTDNIMLPFGGKGLIYIPAGAFGKIEDYNNFLSVILERMKIAKALPYECE